MYIWCLYLAEPYGWRRHVASTSAMLTGLYTSHCTRHTAKISDSCYINPKLQ